MMSREERPVFDAAMHWIGFGLCHQLPERSLFGASHQLPVCARDTGIYIGFVVSLIVIALLDRGRRRAGLPPVWLMVVAALLFASMVWDGATSYLGMRATSNELRLATGLAAGFAISLVVVPILNAQVWRSVSPRRLLGQWWEGLVWLAALPVAYALVWWGGPGTGAVFALVDAVCIFVTFTAVNLVVISLIPRFERAAVRLVDLWPALLISFGLATAELFLAGALRLLLLSALARV